MYDTNWYGKPYYSLDAWCKNTLGHKCYKIALNAHMTCPNRDGSKGTRGCIFCSAGGSGDFALETEGFDIEAQLAKGIANISSKFTEGDAPSVIAYFQAYTNTYAPIPKLASVFRSALLSPHVCGISIATRPDCLGEEVLALLETLQKEFSDKFIWIELGLQTMHESTALYIRRGYPLSCFETALANLKAIRIPVIVHTIIGLPGESAEDMYETIRYLNKLSPFGIKLQLLHVLSDTDLAEPYSRGEFVLPDKDTYLDIVVRSLELLSPEIVVHRVTGDGPKKHLLAPLWSGNKRDVLNSLHRLMKTNNSYQGKLLG